MVVAVVLLILATVFWIYFLWSRRKFYRIAFKIPGPLGLPFFGIAHKVLNMSDVLYELPKLVSSYKSDTLYSWLGPIPVLYTVEPEVVEVVLNHPDCINKSIIYDIINEAIGSGLLTSKSPIWNNHRKLMNPAFSHRNSMRFIPSFNKLAHELCDRLEETINKGEVDVKRYIYNMGFKSSIKNIFGVDIEDETNAKMIGYWDILLDTGSNRAVKPWLRPHAIFSLSNMYKPFFDSVEVLKEFVYTSVSKRFSFNEKINNADANNADTTKADEKTNNVIIDQAIKAFKIDEFTFDDIADEGHILTFASFETSSSTIYTTLMSLAMHPEYQERVFQEIISVFPDKDFDVKYEDFDNLVYLEMCINEALRTAPAIPLIARDTLNDIQIRKDVIIPKGTQIIVDLFNLQRNESIWGPNANCFDPDHFLPQNVKDRHRCAFAPYSKGRRNCAGWQYAGMFLKVSLALILRKYRFSTTFKYEDLKYVFNINLRYGLWPNLEVHRR